MQTLTPTLLLDGLVFPEGPRWRDGKLWFADIWGNKVMTVDEQGRTELIAEMEKPSALGFLPDGSLLVCTFTRQLVKIDKDGPKTILDMSPYAERSLNDMVVDGQGRAYIDAYNMGEGLPPGAIVLVTPDGDARIVADDLSAPNGCVITPDGKTYIVAQMGAHELTAFTVQSDGSLTDRRVFAMLDAAPDGLCLDAEGAVWVGQYEEGRFLRVKEGGEVTHVVPMPGKWTVAPMLGGADRRTLFLVASITSTEDLVQRGKSEGSISTVRVEVPGTGWP